MYITETRVRSNIVTQGFTSSTGIAWQSKAWPQYSQA